MGIATAAGIVVGGAWTIFVFRLLTPYLGPIFSDAVTEIRIALGNGHGDRALFKSSSGGTSPKWEILLILLAAASWCIVLLPALYGVIFKRTVRGGGLRWIPAVIAATYPLSVVANVSSSSKLVAERATTFIFFGMAVVAGAWLAKRMARTRGLIERLGTLGLATIIFLGSLLFGIGPLVTLLPGPYQVGADSLSYGAPSFAVANWASTHLPAGSNVAADKDNGVLLNAIGGVNSVTAESGLVNPELLYFDRSLSLYDIYLIRKADIRYLVVDQRLAQARPLFGTYIADGEPPSRLSLPQLTKFNGYTFVKRIYDNGPIQVFDLTQLLVRSERAAPAGAPAGGWGLNPGIFALALATGALWTLRLRRRWKTIHDGAHLALCALTGALVIGMFGAFLIRIVHAPPEIVAAVVLVILLLLSVRPLGWAPRRWRPAPGPADPPAGEPSPPANGDGPGGDAAEIEELGPTARRNGGADRALSRPSALQSASAAGGAGRVVVGSTFFERREIRDILAYLHVLADPGDDRSLRRVLNVPKRGIGPKSVSRLVNWARRNHVTLREAVDRAREAGFRTQPAAGAAELSSLLSELEPLVAIATPGELVEQVVERTGYRAALATDTSTEAEDRLDNLSELVVRARAYDDLDAFFEGVAHDLASPPTEPVVVAPAVPVPEENATTAVTGSESEDGADEHDGAGVHDDADLTSGAEPREVASVVAPSWWARRRVQVVLGGLGLVLFVGGASVATAAEVNNLRAPAQLSISETTSGTSVAEVQLGTAGPVPARLEVTIGAHTLWSSRLARTTATQNVTLPTRFLYKGSRVRLITDGHTLRWVDGWVSRVPKP